MRLTHYVIPQKRPVNLLLLSHQEAAIESERNLAIVMSSAFMLPLLLSISAKWMPTLLQKSQESDCQILNQIHKYNWKNIRDIGHAFLSFQPLKVQKGILRVGWNSFLCPITVSVILWSIYILKIYTNSHGSSLLSLYD